MMTLCAAVRISSLSAIYTLHPKGIVRYPWVAGERVEKMKND